MVRNAKMVFFEASFTFACTTLLTIRLTVYHRYLTSLKLKFCKMKLEKEAFHILRSLSHLFFFIHRCIWSAPFVFSSSLACCKQTNSTSVFRQLRSTIPEYFHHSHLQTLLHSVKHTHTHCLTF